MLYLEDIKERNIGYIFREKDFNTIAGSKKDLHTI
jgi:hypothetical protein